MDIKTNKAARNLQASDEIWNLEGRTNRCVVVKDLLCCSFNAACSSLAVKDSGVQFLTFHTYAHWSRKKPIIARVVPFFSWWTETQLGIFKMMSLFLSRCNWWQELPHAMEAAAWRAGWHGLFPLAVFVAWPYCGAGIGCPPLWCPAGCQSFSVFFSVPLCHRALICCTKTTCVIQPSKTADEEPTSPSPQTQKCTFITGWQKACLESARIHIQRLSKHPSRLVRVMWRPWTSWQTEWAFTWHDLASALLVSCLSKTEWNKLKRWKGCIYLLYRTFMVVCVCVWYWWLWTVCVNCCFKYNVKH